MMRKLTLFTKILIFALVAAPASRAQDMRGKLDYSLFAGVITWEEMKDEFATDYPLTIDKAGPCFGITAKYLFVPRFAIGVSAMTQNITGKSNPDWTLQQNSYNFTFKKRSFTLATELTGIYLKSFFLELYGVVGGGLEVNSSSYSFEAPSPSNKKPISGVNMRGQFTPIALRSGDDFAFFLELGVGYRGLVNIGFSYRDGRNNGSNKHKHKKHTDS